MGRERERGEGNLENEITVSLVPCATDDDNRATATGTLRCAANLLLQWKVDRETETDRDRQRS